jgi:GT2 family glycosyltransferase
MPEVWTLILRGPRRAPKGFERAFASAEKATGRTHHIHVHDNREENIGIGPAQRMAQDAAMADPEMRYFAKLDDDATVPPGAWDALIVHIKAAAGCRGLRPGAAMAAPPRFKPVVFRRDRESVWAERVGPDDPGVRAGAGWVACEMVGGGATVYTRAVLRAGCLADPGYFSTGVDFDIHWRMRRLGFCSLLCDPPVSTHTHGEVSLGGYSDIRHAVVNVAAAVKHFESKWSLTPRFA